MDARATVATQRGMEADEAVQPLASERAQLRVRQLELRPRRHPVGLP
jgi:hypothetical protein